jgi:hypothetical protein
MDKILENARQLSYLKVEREFIDKLLRQIEVQKNRLTIEETALKNILLKNNEQIPHFYGINAQNKTQSMFKTIDKSNRNEEQNCENLVQIDLNVSHVLSTLSNGVLNPEEDDEEVDH